MHGHRQRKVPRREGPPGRRLIAWRRSQTEACPTQAALLCSFVEGSAHAVARLQHRAPQRVHRRSSAAAPTCRVVRLQNRIAGVRLPPTLRGGDVYDGPLGRGECSLFVVCAAVVACAMRLLRCRAVSKAAVPPLQAPAAPQLAPCWGCSSAGAALRPAHDRPRYLTARAGRDGAPSSRPLLPPGRDPATQRHRLASSRALGSPRRCAHVQLAIDRASPARRDGPSSGAAASRLAHAIAAGCPPPPAARRLACHRIARIAQL